MPRPTMRDVARAAGVAVKTVSRVVNDEPRVHPETAARVRRAIEATGFRRNELARSVRSGRRSAMVALVLGDLTNPFYAQIAKSVMRVAEKFGSAVLMSSADEDPELERTLLDVLVGRQVDGLIVVPDGSDKSYLLPEVVRGTPMVFVDRPPVGLVGDVALLDDLGGARTAVAHLAAHGHRRIAVLVARSYYTTGRRLAGYRAALVDAHGVDAVDPVLVRELGTGSVTEAEAVTAELLDLPDPPTALFTTTSFLTQGAVRAMSASGRRLALVGFDDFPTADQLAVPVTVVAGDADELGTRAAELLFARIEGDTAPPQRIVVPTRLVARGSGEVAP